MPHPPKTFVRPLENYVVWWSPTTDIQPRQNKGVKLQFSSFLSRTTGSSLLQPAAWSGIAKPTIAARRSNFSGNGSFSKKRLIMVWICLKMNLSWNQAPWIFWTGFLPANLMCQSSTSFPLSYSLTYCGINERSTRLPTKQGEVPYPSSSYSASFIDILQVKRIIQVTGREYGIGNTHTFFLPPEIT